MTTRFLRTIRDRCPRDLEFDVLVALRSQATLLASLYSQHSQNRSFASQRAFEQHVRSVLRRPGYGGRAALEWDRLVEQTIQIVGSDRVTVLLFEEISTDRYWHDLAAALRLPTIDPDLRRAPDPGRDNRRSSGEGRWELRPLREPNRIANALRKNGWPVHKRVARRLLCEIDRRTRARDGGSFVLTDSLHAEVSLAMRRSNDRLAGLLRRDLAELGY